MVRNVKGFTLVELMIVIAIIGVLAVALIPTLTGAQSKARDTGRVSALTNIATSMISYKNDAGLYPGSANGCLTDINGGIVGYSNTAGGAAVPAVNTAVANSFQGGKAPLDPQKLTVGAAAATTDASCFVAGSYGYNAGIIKTGDIPYTAGVFVSKIENIKQATTSSLPTRDPAVAVASAPGNLLNVAVAPTATNKFYVKVTE